MSGNGTEAQNNVVLANAGVAIRTYLDNEIGMAIDMARESLESGKAMTALKTLLNQSNNPNSN